MSVNNEISFKGAATYQIKVSGELNYKWSDCLNGMQIKILRNKDEKNNHSILTGLIADQAALHGILNALYNLRFIVISVTLLDIPVMMCHVFRSCCATKKELISSSNLVIIFNIFQLIFSHGFTL